MHLLLDIGGTTTRIATTQDGISFSDPVLLPTPQDFEEGIETIKRAAEDALQGEKPEGAAGGIAGPLNQAKDTLLNAPNLPGWRNKLLKKRLQEALGCEVALENDSALAALGEAHSGAGKGYGIVAYLTVSTGVGGARIVHGEIDQSAMGFEPGHQIVEGKELEAHISGTALQKRTGKHPAEISDAALWEELAEILAVGLVNTAVHWSPEILVLGGSMITGNPAIPLNVVESRFKEKLTIFQHPPKIQKAALGHVGGLHGALHIVSFYNHV